jgi:hypothetical protein
MSQHGLFLVIWHDCYIIMYSRFSLDVLKYALEAIMYDVFSDTLIKFKLSLMNIYM